MYFAVDKTDTTLQRSHVGHIYMCDLCSVVSVIFTCDMTHSYV